MSLLHRVSPFGPIFGKELRTTSRRKRTYLLRVGYLGFLLLFLVLTYASTRTWGMYGGVAWQMQQQAQMGMMFFMCFSLFSVSAMTLIGPVLTATAVNGERLHKTLHVLLMTPITSWQIVSGKLFSRLLGALMLIGLSLPALAMVRLLGGVELSQMVGVVCLAMAAVLFGASVGLLLSTLISRAYAVILLGYGVSLLLQLFVPFVWAFTIESRVNRGAGVPTLAVPAMFSPVMVAGIVGAGQTQMTRMMAIPGAPAWVPVWAPCVALHVTMSLMLVGGTSLLLRREARGSRSGAGTGAGTGAASSQPVGAISSQPVGPAGTLVQSAVLEEPLGVDGATLRPPPLPAGVGRSIESAQRGTTVRTVSDNPVLWRELQRPLMPSRLQRFLGLSAAVVLMLISYWSIGRHLDDSDMQIGYAFVFNFLAMLLACVVSATAIAQEKESDTWTLLLTTPLSGWQIVRGKALGLLKRFIWPTVFVAAHFAIFTAFGVLSVWVCLGIFWILLTFNLIWIATGIYLSLRVKKSTFAVILNLLLPVAAYLLTFLVSITLSSLTRGREDNWIGWILYYLPYFYLATAIEKFDNSSSWLPYLRDVDHMTFAVVTLIVGVLHVILSWIILRYTGLRFDRIVGRAGGSPNDQDPMTNKIPMTNAQ